MNQNNNEITQSKPGEAGLTYKQAGVDIDAGNLLVEKIKPLVRSTARVGSDTEIGGFGGLFDLKACGFKDPILVGANDGVGTKVKIAIEANIHDHIGIDLVAMCVNDLIVQGAEPLFFLDYFACSQLDPDQAAHIIAGIAEGCRQAGCALIGGETAEMPGLYAPNDYDLAGFCVGAVERDALLPSNNMAAGDVILGLASSGVHSNGFSLIRKLVASSHLTWQDTAPFSPHQTLAEALLVPTRIYVRSILSALKAGKGIKALAHITGGGLSENIPRILPQNLNAEIDLNHLAPPPVFKWLATQGAIAEAEMLRIFNCGVGMVIIVAPQQAQTLIQFFHEAGERLLQLGRLVSRQEETRGDRIIYQGTADL